MLALWRPYRGLARWSREFDDVLNWSWGNGGGVGFSPAVDIEEQEDRFILRADLPGLNKKDVDVKVQDNILLLSGKREESKEEEREGGTYRERRFGSFSRQFRLGSNVKTGKIKASYKKGVLTVVLPKRPESQPRQIPVSVN
jgi:HSP20 family protein